MRVPPPQGAMAIFSSHAVFTVLHNWSMSLGDMTTLGMMSSIE